MVIIDKILELISIEKERWIPILLGIIIAGSVGGSLYLNALITKINNYEKVLVEQKANSEQINSNLKHEISILNEFIKELRENNKYLLEHYKNIYSVQAKNAEDIARAKVELEIYKKHFSSKLNEATK
jgi:predicted  nucleic acid-binding Zn-ribbon protein